jgi:hypothetical protein
MALNVKFAHFILSQGEAMTLGAELWTTVWKQADVWSETPAVKAFQDQLPRYASQRTDGVPGVLQELHAGFAAQMVHPLRLGTIVPSLLQADFGIRGAQRGAELDRWLAAAGRIEHAHRATIAWVRSRLPGYPSIKAPQLCRNTPWTSAGWSSLLVWTADERRRGLQFQTAPPDVGTRLGASAEAQSNLASTAQAVATALARTDQWLRFEHETKTLDSTAKNELKEARQHLSQTLSPEPVDAHEPSLTGPTMEYRYQMISESIDSLSGKARSYADAFRGVNTLIDNAASEVFGQLVGYGEPLTLPTSNLDLRGGTPTRVHFEVPEPYILAVDCGTVAWLDDPLVTDAIKIESMSNSLGHTGDSTLKLGGVILDETGDGWRPYRR